MVASIPQLVAFLILLIIGLFYYAIPVVILYLLFHFTRLKNIDKKTKFLSKYGIHLKILIPLLNPISVWILYAFLISGIGILKIPSLTAVFSNILYGYALVYIFLTILAISLSVLIKTLLNMSKKQIIFLAIAIIIVSFGFSSLRFFNIIKEEYTCEVGHFDECENYFDNCVSSIVHFGNATFDITKTLDLCHLSVTMDRSGN